MFKESLKAVYKAHELLQDEISKIKLLLKDTNIELDVRWEVYDELVRNNILTDIKSWGDGFVDTLGDFTLYDHFYIERYETSTFIKMLTIVEEDFDNGIVSSENLVKWKELVLSSGFAGFKYDW